MSSNASRRAGLGRWIIAVVGVFVFAVFGSVLWYAYVEVMGLGASGPPPLVRAEVGPIKRAPDNPGGMEIPNRDSAAARVFQENGDGIRRERILPRQDTAMVQPEPEPEPLPEPAPIPPPIVAAPPAAVTAPPAAAAVAPAPLTPPAATVAPAPAVSAAAPGAPAPVVPPAAAVVPIEKLVAPEPELPVREVRAPPPAAPRPSATVANRPPPTSVPGPPAQATVQAPATPPQPQAAQRAPAAPRATVAPQAALAPTPVVPQAQPPAQTVVRAPTPVVPQATPPAQTVARAPPAGTTIGGTPPARSAPAASPTYRVQLGAFRSDAAANQAWIDLQRRMQAPLGGLRPTVLEAKTSAGTFYRLQAGPLASRDGAVQACNQVKSGGTDCFIVGPLP